MDDKEKIDKIRQHIDDVENRKDVNVRLQFLLIEEIKKILEKLRHIERTLIDYVPSKHIHKKTQYYDTYDG